MSSVFVDRFLRMSLCSSTCTAPYSFSKSVRLSVCLSVCLRTLFSRKSLHFTTSRVVCPMCRTRLPQEHATSCVMSDLMRLKLSINCDGHFKHTLEITYLITFFYLFSVLTCWAFRPIHYLVITETL